MKFLFLLLMMIHQAAIADTWLRTSDPKYFKVENYNLSQHKAFARIEWENGAWSGWHWPNREGSLHYTPSDQNFSPIEKWERADKNANAYNIRTDIDDLLSRYAGLSWGGFCHGYAASSLEYPEPSRKIVNGVKFYHSDIKALMAFYYDYLLSNKMVESFYLGTTCFDRLDPVDYFRLGDRINKNCDDVHPASFHLALTNRIGLKQKGFVMDMDRGHEIWNVPVVGYEFEDLGFYPDWYSHRATGTAAIKKIKLRVYYLGYQRPEDDKEVWGRAGQKVKGKNYEYTLELDRFGKIIGGEWLTFDRPDLLWYSSAFPKPTGQWEILSKLLK